MDEKSKSKLWHEMSKLKMSHLDGEENTEANRFTSVNDLLSRSGRRSDTEWKDSVDESRFRDDLLKSPYKTSSRLSLLQTDTLTSSSPTFNNEELPACSFRPPRMRGFTPADPSRFLGEIAFQLDRRIIAHVFREQTRLYGFTAQNIPDKIQQVCVHPLSGTLDEAYRTRLLERHSEIMNELQTLGYSSSLHPAFSELIVNTYGLLKEPRDALDPACNDPAVLRRLIERTTPSRLMKDLLLLLDCLSFMASRDGQTLFLW